MMRSTRSDAAGRAFRSLARVTLAKIDDSKKVQEVDVNVLQDETKEGVERFQNYGFSSVPLKQAGKKVAEAIVAYLGGNRSHAVVIATDDRRYRPKDLKEGESVFYDDQGQQVHMSRDGIRIKGGDKKLPVHIDIGDVHFEVTKDQVMMKVGDNTIKLNSEGFFANDHKIDHTHKHKDVMPGAGLTGVPE